MTQPEKMTDGELVAAHQALVGDAIEWKEKLDEVRGKYRALEPEIISRRSLRTYAQGQFPQYDFSNWKGKL